MNLDKIYHDVSGQERNILGMVKHEPEWSANRIQIGEQAIEALKQAVEVIKMFHGEEVFDIYYNHSPEMKKIREALGPYEQTIL